MFLTDRGTCSPTASPWIDATDRALAEISEEWNARMPTSPESVSLQLPGGTPVIDLTRTVYDSRAAHRIKLWGVAAYARTGTRDVGGPQHQASHGGLQRTVVLRPRASYDIAPPAGSARGGRSVPVTSADDDERIGQIAKLIRTEVAAWH